MRDPHMHLVRALAERAAGPVALVETRCYDWNAPTFSGHRHMIRFALRAAEEQRLCAGLDTDAVGLRGHVLAEIAVVERGEGQVAIRALTVRAV